MYRTAGGKVFVAAGILAAAVFVHGAAAAESKEQTLFQLNLSQKILRVLKGEMNAIQNSMTNLSIAIPAGKWSDILETAEQMQAGYFLKKKLSGDQMR
jgi:hypothetical protein